MEVIKTYLDNVFAAYPQTHEMQRMKQNMLANMEEKYLSLRQGGKNEHEAAYSVIADFGSIEEVTAELGLDTGSVDCGKSIALPPDEVQTYLTKSKQTGVLVALGVWLIIAGVSTVIFLNNVFIMFVAIAVAVGMFILSGSRVSKYNSFEEKSIRLDGSTRSMVEEERARLSLRWTGMVALGVILIIITVGLFTVIDVLPEVFLNVVGFSVFLFVIAGMHSSAYDVLLGKGDYGNKAAIKQGGRIIGTLAAVYWPATVALYLLWSFAADAWHISWVIWPVAGVLFAAISGGVSVWFSTKEK